MRAAVFHKPRDIRCEEVPDPEIEEPRDAIVRVTSTAICGSDLHIYNGFIPQLRNMILGHEFMGIVEEVGSEVTNLKKGDRVVVPFPIACGECFNCSHKVPVGCEKSNPKFFGPRGGVISQKGGALFGYTDLYGGVQGGQAEAVRVPYADYGPRKVPDNLTDEQALLLSDVIPTAWTGLEWANMKGGEVVVVFGCGPVGLMTQKLAWLKGAKRVIGVDVLPYRINMAREICRSEVINNENGQAVSKILEMTSDHGADIVIDAVGMEAERSFLERFSNIIHFQLGTIKVLRECFSAVRRGGHISVLGVYGTTYDNFPLGQWFDKGISVRAGQAPVHNYIDELELLVESGKLKPDEIITHRMPLEEVSKAYDIFNNKKDNCIKVILKP